ncbi:hypothetical protein FACS1894161_4490 [Spirochaetia bacterium]|nr:hypothetical protein FACS1894161_4490 [Spirochaetia bacterium]
MMTAEEVYTLITGGDLSRSAAIGVIRAYGNREVIKSLEQAQKAASQDVPQSFLDEEIGARLANCLQRLDEFIGTIMTAHAAIQEKK